MSPALRGTLAKSTSPAGLLLLALVLGPRLAPAAGPPGPDQPVPAAPAKSREQLFREVFKRPAPDIAISGYVLVQVDGGSPHKIRAVLPSAGQGLLLQADAVLPLLSGLLPPSALQGLRRAVDREGWLTPGAIEEAGVATAFDAARFIVTMKSDPALRPRSITYLSGQLVDPSTANALRPAAASAFLNVNVKAASRTEAPAAASPSSGVGFSLDGAVNVNGWVLEGSGFGHFAGTHSIQRGDFRLVHDQPQRSVRYSAGDLRYPLVGYQAAVGMAGVGISKDPSLQPHLHNRHAGGFQFYLERPAEVKVLANGALLSVLRLPAGHHDLRGLSPVSGLNDMRLEIEDSAGRKEILVLAFAHAPALLEQGGSLYSYNLGWRRVDGAPGHHYDQRNPVLSASHLLGVASDTTLGGYLQADASRAVLGLHAVRAFAAGAIQLDAATSRADSGWGRAARLRWTGAATPQRGWPVQAQASVEYLSKNFATLTERPRAEHDRINVDGSVAFPLGYATSAEFSVHHTPAPGPGLVDAHGLVAGVTRRIGRHTTIGVSWRNGRSSLGQRHSGIFFGLTWSFSDGANTFYAAKDMQHDALSLSWRTAAPTHHAAPYAFAASRWASRLRDTVAGVGYAGPQGLAELTYHETDGGQHSASFKGGEAALRLQGALVYADGLVALSRPVAESFAIVKGKEGLAQTVLRVDPDSTGGSRARSTWLGPAVVTDLGNYRLRELRIEPVDPPLGATPEKTTYSVAPGYKSGLLLLVGRETSIVAVGRLLDGQGQPLRHLPIEVRRVGDAGLPLSTFTSRSGAFQLPGVKPGRYEIRAAQAGDGRRVLVEVPQAPDGLHRLGDLQVPER